MHPRTWPSTQSLATPHQTRLTCSVASLIEHRNPSLGFDLKKLLPGHCHNILGSPNLQVISPPSVTVPLVTKLPHLGEIWHCVPGFLTKECQSSLEFGTSAHAIKCSLRFIGNTLNDFLFFSFLIQMC